MWMIIVFAAIFLAIVLLLLGFTSANAAQEKRTAERLQAIRLGNPDLVAPEQPVDIRLVETFSALPWLNRWLEAANLGPQLKLLLRQADLKWTVGRLVLISLFLGLCSGYLVEIRTHAPFLALAIAVVAGACPLFYVLQMRSRRFDRIRTLLPDAIDLMVSAIRAGHSLNSAIGMVSREASEPVRGEFRQCYDEQNFGLDIRTAMSNLAVRVPIHDIRIITAGVLIQRDTGGNLTEILEKVGYLIREDFRLQRQIRVHTAQGRLTGYILALLPLFLGIAMYMLNPDQMSLLWRRPIGLKLLYASVISTTIGMLIIRKIVRFKV